MISPTVNAILKVLGHLHCNFGLARLLGPKNDFPIIVRMGGSGV